MRPALILALAGSIPLAAGAAPKAKPAAKKPAPSPIVGPDLPSNVPPGVSAATVNGEAIPFSLYLDRLSLRYGPEVREGLIQEALVRQEAKRRGISASAADIDAVVQATFADTVRRAGDETRLAEEL